MYLDLAIRSADYFDGAAEVTYSRNLNFSSNSTFFVRLNGRYCKANLAESYKTYDSRYMVHLTHEPELLERAHPETGLRNKQLQLHRSPVSARRRPHWGASISGRPS
ncbi:MAG: hypothetical protein ACLR8Y_19525 [Alistipes indistinctus]